MVDDVEHGRRPVLVGKSKPSETARLLPACPGAGIVRPPVAADADSSLAAGWGSVLGMWEGWAADGEIRYAGSSGGAASALSLHALVDNGFAGVLHTAARADQPVFNETVMSTTRSELLERTGSRYSPASPCDSLDLVESASGPIVFVGKPCDVAGLQVARQGRPRLDERTGVTIAVFCAGTPTTRGTIEMLERMGIDDPASVTSLRYRGMGWPGLATVTSKTPDGPATQDLDYDGSWNAILQKHRQWRCRLCLDHTGELADISVGDPWYRPNDGDDPGRSLVIARTPRGLALVQSAIAAGALHLEPVSSHVLPRSQPNLVKTRGAVAARVAVLRALGMQAPTFKGFPSWRFWWANLSWREKASSIVGTVRRSWLHRAPVIPTEASSRTPWARTR